MLGKMNGFISYLISIPGYIWYSLGELVVKGLFPKSFEVWFAGEIQGLEDTRRYLEEKDVLFHKRLEQNNKVIEDLLNENEKLRLMCKSDLDKKNQKKASKRNKNGTSKKSKR